MSRIFLLIAAILVAAIALALPFYLDAYQMGLAVGLLGFITLATAWAMFSGPTGYISLATVAFFGTGAYVVALFSEVLPYPLVLLIAAMVGAIMALIVGLSTLRLAGVYFVIFSFGLAELVRQLVTWYEVNISGTLGRYIFLPLQTQHIYWQLLVLMGITFGLGYWIRHSRLGLALNIIGDDEVVAQHCGINITQTKLALFTLSAVIITLVGAIQAPRWVYIEPSIVFNPTISFMTLIMALLGGARRLFGPALGAIPLFLLFEWLSSNFPDHYPIILGLLFIAIVFVVPNGVLAFFDDRIKRGQQNRQQPASVEEGA